MRTTPEWVEKKQPQHRGDRGATGTAINTSCRVRAADRAVGEAREQRKRQTSAEPVRDTA